MKNLISAGIGLLLCALSVPHAHAQKENIPYFSVDIGVAGQAATDVRDLEVQTEKDEADVDLGYRVGVSLGYLLREGAVFAWRTGASVRMSMEVELETGVIWNKVDLGGLESAGAEDLDLYRFPLMANIGFHVPVSERARVAAGGGLGALVSYGSTERDDLGSGSAADVGFAWQIFADFSYDLTPSLSVGGFYKVLNTADSKLKDDTQISLDGGFVHTLGVSVRWLF